MKHIQLFEEFVNEAVGFKGDLSKDDIEIPKFKLNLSKLKQIRDKMRLVYDKRYNFYEDKNYSQENRSPELDALDKELFGLVNDYNVEAKRAFRTLLVAVDKLQLPAEAGLRLEYSQNDRSISTLGFGDDHRNTPDNLRVKNVFQGFLQIAWEYIPPRSRKKRWTSRNMYLSQLVQGFAEAMDGGRSYKWAFKGEFGDEQLKDYLTTVYD